ncbi:hypothetical protein LY78DRAFT_472179 [Colletotrichum sublineola]|nr:hypothetical protein LY78DRAFT_472179 [Colletotrichum sublineola]
MIDGGVLSTTRLFLVDRTILCTVYVATAYLANIYDAHSGRLGIQKDDLQEGDAGSASIGRGGEREERRAVMEQQGGNSKKGGGRAYNRTYPAEPRDQYIGRLVSFFSSTYTCLYADPSCSRHICSPSPTDVVQTSRPAPGIESYSWGQPRIVEVCS